MDTLHEAQMLSQISQKSMASYIKIYRVIYLPKLLKNANAEILKSGSASILRCNSLAIAPFFIKKDGIAVPPIEMFSTPKFNQPQFEFSSLSVSSLDSKSANFVS